MSVEVYIRRLLATYFWGEWRLSQKVNWGCQEVGWSAKQECLDRHRVGFCSLILGINWSIDWSTVSTSESTISCTLTVNTLANGKIVRRKNTLHVCRLNEMWIHLWNILGVWAGSETCLWGIFSNGWLGATSLIQEPLDKFLNSIFLVYRGSVI